MLAYGQTGSGKTFTISGILDRIAFDLFKERDPNAIRIHVSMFELLGSQVFLKKSLQTFNFLTF
jgi:hypothetical protein